MSTIFNTRNQKSPHSANLFSVNTEHQHFFLETLWSNIHESHSHFIFAWPYALSDYIYLSVKMLGFQQNAARFLPWPFTAGRIDGYICTCWAHSCVSKDKTRILRWIIRFRVGLSLSFICKRKITVVANSASLHHRKYFVMTCRFDKIGWVFCSNWILIYIEKCN